MHHHILRTALAALLATGASAMASPLYHVVNLGAGWGLTMNQKGDAAGYALQPTSEALVFHRGKAKRLADFGLGGFAYGPSVGGTSFASGIDAQGTIIGGDVNYGVYPAQIATWYIDPQGVRHAFPLMSGGDFAGPSAVNPSGQVAGSANTSPGGSSVTGVNAQGIAVGNADTATPRLSHPFVWSAGTMTDLLTLLDGSGAKWSRMYVHGVDDRGRIVGTGQFKGTDHAFMLMPL